MRRCTANIVWNLLSATAVLVVLPQSLSAQVAAAPQEGSGGLQDIVVTARRTNENLQRIPVSVTAFGANDLRSKAVQGLGDLQRATPSLQTNTNSSNSAGIQISMRGQVQTDTAANSAASVGVYLDDVYLGGASLAGGLLNVSDLDRVEVLKGAQGTLYGRNVTGGVVKFVTKKPDESEFDASITGGFGNYARHYIASMINIPMVEDRMAFRLDGSFDEHAGYSHDVVNDRDLDDMHKWNVRGALKIDPTEKLDILVQGWAARGHDNGTDARVVYIQPGLTTEAMNIMAVDHVNGLSAGALAPLILGAAGGYTPQQIQAATAAATAALPKVEEIVANYLNAPRDQAQGNPDFPQFSRAKDYGSAVTVAYDLGSARVRSISAYDLSRRESGFSVGGGFETPLFSTQMGSNSQFTQELQITGKTFSDRLTYAAGLYYLKSNIRDDRLDSAQGGPFPLFLGQYGLGLTNGVTQANRIQLSSKAAYGQATYALTSNINLTGGLRYTSESASNDTLSIAQPSLSNGLQLVCAGPSPDTVTTPLDECAQYASIRSHNLSYTAGADWTIVRGVMVYAKTSRGFKAGGVNSFPPTYGPFQTYKPEVSTDYEAGIKSEFWQHRARFNLTYYHTNYDNIQRTVTVPAGGGTIATSTQNAANAKIDGIELEAQIVPVHGLTLSATGAYTDARFVKYITARPAFPDGVQDISDQPFQTLAKYTYSLSGAYEFRIGTNKVITEIDWSHRSKANMYPSDLFPTTPGGTDASPAYALTQKAYGVLNGTVTVEVPDYHATVTVWAKNILNKRYFQTLAGLVNAGLGLDYANLGPPATFGVDLTFHLR